MKVLFKQVRNHIFALTICLIQLVVVWETAFGANNDHVQQSTQSVTVSIKSSLMDIWASFVAHIPYFVAGLILLILTWVASKFENGDFIECEGKAGEVEKVSVRMTEIRLRSSELVVIPNSMFFKNPVEILN